MTDKQKIIANRRSIVGEAYKKLDGKEAVTPLVNYLAKRFHVSTVTIYKDLKDLNLTNPKPRKVINIVQ